MSAKILHVTGCIHESTIDMLTNAKVIVSRPYGTRSNSWLVARWGVNRQALRNYEKKLSGEK